MRSPPPQTTGPPDISPAGAMPIRPIDWVRTRESPAIARPVFLIGGGDGSGVQAQLTLFSKPSEQLDAQCDVLSPPVGQIGDTLLGPNG